MLLVPLYAAKILGLIALITLYQKYLMDLRLYTSPSFFTVLLIDL